MMDIYHGILYVGDAGQGRKLHDAAGERGWYVYVPTEAREALGIYIFYMPAIVVIDASSDFAHEVYRHLHSVEAGPLLVLADKAQEKTWNISGDSLVLPKVAHEDEIIAAIASLLDSREAAAA
jgi:hypothetical protein